MKNNIATFGAGCFWHVEEEFRKISGVTKTTAGYMGGELKNPSYGAVCTDRTGHVEVCRIEYNPDIISYEQLLDVFWNVHDPTQLNRQGPDVGSQYKSVIFFHDEEQKKKALKSRSNEQRKHAGKIVTEIIPAKKFYETEEYHQKYLKKRGFKTC